MIVLHRIKMQTSHKSTKKFSIPRILITKRPPIHALCRKNSSNRFQSQRQFPKRKAIRAIISLKGEIIFRFISRVIIPSGSSLYRRPTGRESRVDGGKWWKKEGKRRGVARSELQSITSAKDDGSYSAKSPRNNGSPFYSWSTPLFENPPRGWKDPRPFHDRIS